MRVSRTIATAVIFFISLFTLTTEPALASGISKSATSASSTQWWIWPVLLFIVTLVMGIVAVLAGVGGGVLFTPIIGGFFPFNMDFVRAAGLIVALSGSLAAGPGLLKKGMADLRLAIPVALIASSAAIVGAMIGLALPDNITQTTLGIAILAIVAIMLLAKKSEYPEVKKADSLSSALRITGIYHEAATGQDINWKIHRTPQSLITFIFIGIMAGMFGLGAGWANVPVLNLMMGAPLKVSVATSKFLLSITDTSAAWVYINKGAVIPMIIVPSVVGIMLGSFIGVRLLAKTKPSAIKIIVIALLAFSGLRALLKGIGIWT
ncbi:MAG: sulfite exporter TauE/SafE family protein [Actinomycetota bacterium]